ncbi:hypothetical protein DPEC_G00116290 [Dallia pectoralis]|uniref:Uncharacterized protein n=1 Tax=Dallia pectoralis TaxID=75939 RepID=A0ACC2GU55_DALPE|nr:hypothetical protein DPEC_G00116290 [Dallia pectoralis]
MSDMAANRLSGVICLVLLSVVVHCYPYGEAYKTVVKHPTNRGHFLSRYPYPDKEDGDSDDKPVALESVQEGSLLRSFYPRAFEESSNNGLGPSPEGADGQMPILSPANQKTVNSPYTWPTAIKRFPAQSVNVRIRRPFQSHFRAGDIANVRTVYEHGNSQTESEEQRFPATRPEGGADGDFPSR